MYYAVAAGVLRTSVAIMRAPELVRVHATVGEADVWVDGGWTNEGPTKGFIYWGAWLKIYANASPPGAPFLPIPNHPLPSLRSAASTIWLLSIMHRPSECVVNICGFVRQIRAVFMHR